MTVAWTMELLVPHMPVVVNTVGPSVEGVVTGIWITVGGVRYQVGYWSGKDWKETYFDEAMVKAKAGSDKLKIGYKV